MSSRHALGVHRSVAYRLLRTLEDHGLVVRDAGGRVAARRPHGRARRRRRARPAGRGAPRAHRGRERARHDVLPRRARPRRVRHAGLRRASARGRLGRAAAGDAASGQRRRSGKAILAMLPESAWPADARRRAARPNWRMPRRAAGRRATTRSSRACARSRCRSLPTAAGRVAVVYLATRTTPTEIAARLQRVADGDPRRARRLSGCARRSGQAIVVHEPDVVLGHPLRQSGEASRPGIGGHVPRSRARKPPRRPRRSRPRRTRWSRADRRRSRS